MTPVLTALSLAVALSAGPAPEDEPIDVEVQRPRAVAVGLSSLEFTGGPAADGVEAAFRRAVRASGLFELDAGPSRGGSPRWRVRCAVEGAAAAGVTARLVVSDAVSGRQIASEVHRGPARAVAHALADSLHGCLRNAPPVFAAPLAAVRASGKRHELVVSEWDGGSPRVAYAENGPLLLHDWHPDGRRLAFTTWRSGKPELWLLDLSAGTVQPLVTLGEMATGAAFSPDGTRLAFVSGTEGDVDLYVARADGTGARRVTSDSAVESSPSWSRDGSRLAFVSSRRGRPHAFVMNADGGDVAQLTSALAEEQSVRFAPRGDLLAVVGRTDDGTWGVFTISATHRDLVAVSRRTRAVPSASWSADGELLAYAAPGEALAIVNCDGQRRTHTNITGLAGIAWRAARR